MNESRLPTDGPTFITDPDSQILCKFEFDGFYNEWQVFAQMRDTGIYHCVYVTKNYDSLLEAFPFINSYLKGIEFDETLNKIITDNSTD